MSGQVTCPGCGDEYARIGSHWAMSSSCDFPRFSEAQRELLAGILLTGGMVTRSRGATDARPFIAVKSTNRSLLAWLREQFPRLATDLSLASSADDAAKRLQEVADDDRAINTSDVYRWQTRSLPHVADIEERWTDAETGDRTIPEAFTPTPLSLAVAYGFAGYLWQLTGRDDAKRAACFTAGGLTGSVDDWTRLLSPFDPVVQGRDTDSPRIVIRDSIGFFEYLASDERIEAPLAGTSDRWPATPTADDARLTAPDGDMEECPACGVRFSYLARHWSLSPCSPPALDDETCAFLAGLTFGDGHTKREAPTSHARIAFHVADREFANWLREYLGVLVSEVRANRAPAVSSERTATPDSYIVTTRPHPAFDEFREWYESDEMPREVAEQEPAFLRGLYATDGACRASEGDADCHPRVYLSRRTYCEWLRDELAAFDPREVPSGRERYTTLCLGDADAFFEYIGRDPVPGCAEKWPPSDAEAMEADI